MLRRYPALFLFAFVQLYIGVVVIVANIDDLSLGLLAGTLITSGGVITAHRLYDNWQLSRTERKPILK
jgi:hypothetical protein